MKKISLLVLMLALFSFQVFAQDEAETAEPVKEWKTGLGIGLDFAQLLQINPKVGAGENRIAFGGALNVFANMKNGKHSWDNSASWKIGVQKLGGGLSILNPDVKVPYQKSIDELRFDTKYGYAISNDNKWYAATELSFLSQVLKAYSGNFMKDILNPGVEDDPISKFLSPAQLTYSVGIDYKPNDNLSLYYSPIALKMIIVAADAIADDEAIGADGPTGTSVHGNPWRSLTDFDNVDLQMGSLFKAQYQNKFFSFQEGDKESHRMLFKTYLALYYDYLQGQKRDVNPDYKFHTDVDWGTETSFNIFKGLQIVLTTNLFYDWDVAVQETDYSKVGGVSGNLVRKVSFTEQLLIKYAINF